MSNLDEKLVRYAIDCIRENNETSKVFNKSLGLDNRVQTVETVFSENVSKQWNKLLEILVPEEFGEYDAEDGSPNTELDIAYNLICDCIYEKTSVDDLIKYLKKHKILGRETH